MPLTPIARAAALRSPALATIMILAVGLALAPPWRVLAAPASDKPAATATDTPAAKTSEKKTSDKKASDKKNSDKKTTDKKKAPDKKSSDKKASDKKQSTASDKKTTASEKKHDVPKPQARPVARSSVPPTVPPQAATAPARELASPSLPPPMAAPAPPARQKVTAPTQTRKQVAPAAVAATSATSREDMEQLEEVIDLVRKHKPDDATQAEASISDPVAKKLAEWIILRSDNNNATVERYRAFVSANPSWPSQTFLRRRLEAALWDDSRDDAVVWSWFENESPISAKGKFSLARAMLARGDRANAERLVKDAWRNDAMSEDTENNVLDMFGALIA